MWPLHKLHFRVVKVFLVCTTFKICLISIFRFCVQIWCHLIRCIYNVILFIYVNIRFEEHLWFVNDKLYINDIIDKYLVDINLFLLFNNLRLYLLSLNIDKLLDKVSYLIESMNNMCDLLKIGYRQDYDKIYDHPITFYHRHLR